MKFVWLMLLALALASAVAATKISFEGYKLFNIYPQTHEQLQLIAELEHSPDFDLWSRVRPGVLKVSLAPSALSKYQAIFKLFNIKSDVVHENLQDIIDEQEAHMRKRDLTGSSRSIVGTYARYSEIQSWIFDQADQNDFVSTYVTGTTEEKRDLNVIVIGLLGTKRKIWIDCGIHAREWVSPSTCVWIAQRLIDGAKSNDKDIVDVLSYYEFHILPVMNPDGYEYSHTSERMWRKNRHINDGSKCVGVDLNRNFGYQWGTGGSSSLPCSDTYMGTEPNSELETKAVQKAINAALGSWDAFLTVHSYGKWLFTPYGYTDKQVPPDFDVLNGVAKQTVEALQAVYGETGWVHGSSAKILYIASGGSEDWSYGVANIKYSYCFELRPGQSGPDSQYGFLLPEEKAPLAGEETFVGVMKMFSLIRQ